MTPALLVLTASVVIILLGRRRPVSAHLSAQLREAEADLLFYRKVLRQPCVSRTLHEVAGFEYDRALRRVKALKKKLKE